MNARAVYYDLRSYYKFSVVGQATRASTLNDLDLQLIDWRGSHLRFFNQWDDHWKRLEELEKAFRLDRIKRMYLEKVINSHESYENITETEELILTVNKEQTGEDGSEITFKHFWTLCIKKATKIDMRHNQVGPAKTKRRMFNADVSANDSDYPSDLPDDKEDNNDPPILVNKMSQLQRRRGALTEEEKLPSYLWKQLNDNLQDWKFWLQISSDGKKKIVKCIPSSEPQENIQVMQTVFQSVLHQRYNDENQDEEQVEESSDSDDTRDHDYLINQA